MRAVAFLYFIAWFIPAFVLAGVVVIDASSAVDVNHEVVLAAETAALAGAQQISNGQLITDPNACPGVPGPCTAQQVALATWDQEVAQGSVPNASTGGVTPVVNLIVADGVPTVQVIVHYEVQNMIFTAVPWIGDYANTPYTVTEEAFVCSSTNTNGPTSGECSTPQEAY
jgi:Flp pilus assembly protein TadG